MSSARLPGKVLRPLAGRPLLAWLLDGLQHATSTHATIVATSAETSDDPLAEFARTFGVGVFRGDLDDVAGRLLEAAHVHSIDPIVRVCADSPVLDPAIVDQIVAAYREHGPDLATNTHPRSFPRGQSCEVVSRDALARAHHRMSRRQKEHVTAWFYENEHEVSISNVGAPVDLSGARHCVDTEEDAHALDRLLREAPEPPWRLGYADLAARQQRSAEASGVEKPRPARDPESGRA